jgi:hypothetical protein
MVVGRFDTPTGVPLLSGTFASEPLPVGTVPAVDEEVRTFLQSGGFEFGSLGWRFIGNSMGCQNGVISGNVYSSMDPRITAIRGADQVIFIPVRFSCSTDGIYPMVFGMGEAVLLIHFGPPAAAGYLAPVDVMPWSGVNTAISSGMGGLNLMLNAQ